MTDDLVTWLRAQIAAAREQADTRHTLTCNLVLGAITGNHGDKCDCPVPASVLAQCQAHAALLDAYENAEARRIRLTEAFTRNLRTIAELDPHEERKRYSEVSKANGVATGYGMAVRLAASCYQHNPGYHEEWRP